MQQRLPIPLPMENFRSSAESEKEADDDATAAAHSEGKSEDEDPEVPSISTPPLANQIRALTMRFDAYWDETQEHRVALSKDMDALKAKVTIIRSN